MVKKRVTNEELNKSIQRVSVLFNEFFKKIRNDPSDLYERALGEVRLAELKSQKKLVKNSLNVSKDKGFG